MLNLFVLIILQQFEENYLDPNNPLKNFSETSQVFKHYWVNYAMEHEGLRMHERQLLNFLLELPEPLGFGKIITSDKNELLQTTKQVNLRRQAAKVITKLNIQTDIEGFVYFHELLHGLMKRAFAEDVMQNLTWEGFKILNIEEMKAIKIMKEQKNQSILRLKDSSIYQLSGGKKQNLKYLASKEVANPLHQILFVGMSYKAWANYAKKKMFMKVEAQVQDKQYNTDEMISSNAQSITEEDFVLSDDEDEYNNNNLNLQEQQNKNIELSQGSSIDSDEYHFYDEDEQENDSEPYLKTTIRLYSQDTSCYENQKQDSWLKDTKMLQTSNEYIIF